MFYHINGSCNNDRKPVFGSNMLSSSKIPITLKYLSIVVCCYLCFGSHQALDGDFVFDDNVAIKKNKDVTTTPILDVFKHDFWGSKLDKHSHGSFRPVCILTYKLEYHLYGLNPYYMKIVNLVLHAFDCCLLYYVLNTIVSHESISFFASVMFAVHPIHTEVVSGIVGRAELLSCLVFLFSLLIYWKWNVSFIYQSSLLGLLSLIGLLCKESAIMILPSCVMLDVIKNQNILHQLKRSKLSALKRNMKNYVLCFLTLILLYFRLYIINFEAPDFKPMDNPLAASNYTLTRVLTQNYLYALNLWLLLCPNWLCFDWALGTIKLVEQICDYRVAFIVLFYIFIIGLLLFGSKNEMAALTFVVLPFLPASGLIKVGFVIAERVLYVPSIGYCLLISIGMHKIMNKRPRLEKIIKLGFYSLIIIFIAKSFTRALEWRNEEVLFKSALSVCGNNAKVHYNVARVAAEKNNRELAISHYEKAIELYPEYESALMNLGNLYRESNEYEKAEYYLKKSIEAMEDFPTAWMNLGIVQAAMKNYNDALASYRKALQYRKNYANCYYNIGNLYIDMNNSSMALKYWKETIHIDPKHSKAWSNILALLDNKGLVQEILETSAQALKFVPDDASILFSRANAFGKLGQFNESEALFLRAIQKNPKSGLFHANLGVLYHRFNKKKEALEYYRKAIELDPKLKSARQNMQKLLDTK